MKSQLMSRDLWDYIVTNKTEEDDEKIRNEEAKTLMYVSMEASEISATGVCNSAHDLWLKIKENHEGAEANLKSICLAEFLGLKYRKGETIVSYSGRYERLLGNLETIDYKIDEKTKLWAFSNSLPEHMMSVVQMFTLAKSDGKVSELITELKTRFINETYESGRKTVAYNTHEKNNRYPAVPPRRNYERPTDGRMNHEQKKTYVAKNRYENRNPTEQRNRTLTCNYCKKVGHVWRECRKLKSDEERKRSTDSNRRENYATHEPAGAFTAKSHEFSQGKSTWIIDSGATSHMTPYGDHFVNYVEFDNPHSIFLGDGTKLKAFGRGDIPFTSENYMGTLTSVLWVPDMKENLFSVCRATEQGCEVSFLNNNTSVTFYRNGRIVLRGEKTPAGRCFLLHLVPSATTDGEQALIGTTMEEWHRRFGHCSYNTIKEMIRSKAVDGLEVMNKTKQDCYACISGKMCRAHHPPRSTIKANETTAVLHIDTVGPMRIQSLGGGRYFVLATEEFSGYKLASIIATKAAIPDVVKSLINRSELDSGRTVKSITTDNGTEFTNSSLEKFLNDRGIIHNYSVPYTPQQNGRAERSNRSILDTVRTLLIDSKLPEELWGEALVTAVYITNRTISKGDPSRTRYELFCNKKPNVNNMRIFGQKAMLRIPDNAREGKLGERGQEATFVGYTSLHNTYRFYITEPIQQIIESCDVRFLSGNEKADKKDEEEEFISLNLDNLNLKESTDMELLDNSSVSTEIYHTSKELTDESDGEFDENTLTTAVSNFERPATRAYTRALNDEETLTDDSANRAWDNTLFVLGDEPRSLKDARESPQWEQWQQAMQEELSALAKNKTWVLIDRPPNTKPIKNKWVFKVKLKPSGEVDRYRARLVAKGYTQIENIDYKETYAPVAGMITVRLFLGIANQQKMKIVQFDIKTAFLYGNLEEQLIMEQPEGYEIGNKVCLLTKSLYGLKQAPRQWNLKFDSFLKRFNLQQASVDKCLYFNHDKSLMLAIYVDDGLAAGRDRKQLDDLLQHLRSNFELTTMNCEAFLGFKITRNIEDGSMSLHQSHFIDKILEKFKMTESKPVSTPEQVGAKLADSPLLPEGYPYKELVGSLLYLATCSRPDISHAVSVASQTSKPTLAHWQALKRILRYLKGSKDLCIRFRWEKESQLTGYSDSDYANDEKTRRSTTGYCILYGGTPIAWRSQRQPIVTLSTTEAEYVAGCSLVKELIPIREQLIELNELDKNQPTTVFIDNLSTVKIATNESGQSRTKHIDIRQKWLTEQSMLGKIRVAHIRGEEQCADILTKPLYKTKFQYNRSKLLTNLIVTLTVLSICSQNIEAKSFQETDPLSTASSEYAYIRGDSRYKLRNVFLNPCEVFFNYSSTISATEMLIKKCLEYYEEKLLKPLSNCKQLPTIGPELNQVATTYSCLEDIDPKLEVDLTAMGKCDLRKRLVEPNKLQGIDLAAINEDWNKHKALVTGLPKLKRTKRVLGLLVAIAGFTVLAGSQIKTVERVNTNTNDIAKVSEVADMHSTILRQQLEIFEQMRNTVMTTYDWSQEVEERLSDIQQNTVQMRDPNLKGKRASLVKMYMAWFENHQKLLQDINRAAEKGRIPPSLKQMVNSSNWDDTAAGLSKLFECSYHLENKSLVVDLDFLLPIIDRETKVLSVHPMNHYSTNNTTDSETEVCWNEYKGPMRVLYNKTSNCISGLQMNRVYDNTVRSQACTEQDFNELYDKRFTDRLWNADKCYKEAPDISERIQIQTLDGVHKIYCHPFNIKLENISYPCPINPIILEGHASFEIGNISHQGIFYDNTVTRKVRSTKQESRFKRSALTTNITNEVKIASNATIKPRLNINGTLIGLSAKMNATYLRLKETINRLPMTLNITREQLKTILENPVDSIKEGFEILLEYVSSIGSWMGILGVVMFLVMIMPMLEIIFIGIKLIKIPANIWMRSAKRVGDQFKEFEKVPLMPMLMKRKKRWDENIKRV